MGKFGKKKEISLNPLSYRIGILGESGIGKSSLAYEVCEKLVGSDGYIMLDIGREDGHRFLDGAPTEKIEDWAKFDEVVTDIVENKDEYPDLKVLVIDTYDELCRLAEEEAVRLYNIKNMGKKDFVRVDTINAAWGGFGKGLDKTVDLIFAKLEELRTVNVSFILISHVKRTDLTDVTTGATYCMLTASTTQRYWNAIKNSCDIVGMGYFDRTVKVEKTGKKDMNGKEVTRNVIETENRKITFRDDNYSVDCKSRAANIVDEIPFDADAFIKAIQDAILASKKDQSAKAISAAKKKAEAEEKAAEEIALKVSAQKKQNKVDVERNMEIIEELKAIYAASKNGEDNGWEQKKAFLTENGIKLNAEYAEKTPTKLFEEALSKE